MTYLPGELICNTLDEIFHYWFEDITGEKNVHTHTTSITMATLLVLSGMRHQ